VSQSKVGILAYSLLNIERCCCACISRKYFVPVLQTANVNPLLVTTGLMCPEAYIIHDALTGYINNESPTQINERVAKA